MSIETLIPVLGANLIWQTLLLALVVGVTLRILPKHAAKIRYQVALVALFGAGLLCAAPFLPDLTPDLSVGLTPQIEFSVSGPVSLSPEALSTQNLKVVVEDENPQIPLGRIILMIWMTGTLVALIRLARAAVTAQTWARNAAPLTFPNQSVLSKRVRIRRSTDISTPLVLGFFKPVVLVPDDFDLSLENPGTRAVLEHEIAHLIRGDLWTNLAQHLVLALLWWCAPLYWINAQIGIEREKLCDDMAAQKIGTGRALATALVDLVDKHPKQQSLLAIGVHPHAHNLAERIHRLCKETPMPKLSKQLLLTSSLAVPALIGSLILAAPRAVAHSPVVAHSASHASMDDVSSVQNALFKATSLGRADEVRDILALGTDPAFYLHGDGTPLILAAKLGNVEIADLLLSHGAEINRMTASDESALINAVKTNHLDMVKYLVERGADVSLGQVSNPMHEPEWRSPLSTAQKHGHTQIAQYLQANGAVADSRTDVSRRLPHGPIIEGRLTSKFGTTREKFGGKMHRGIDITNAEGTPIYAPADGTITVVSSNYNGNPKYGHVVVLETVGGVKTVFAHLQDSQVSSGQTVIKGTQIARLGNTGQSTGPHVHIETIVNGKLKDPMTVWKSLPR